MATGVIVGVVVLAVLFLIRVVGIKFNARQIASIGIFSVFIYGTLLFGEFRLAFAFGGAAGEGGGGSHGQPAANLDWKQAKSLMLRVGGVVEPSQLA